jgi:hypothetical protein
MLFLFTADPSALTDDDVAGIPENASWLTGWKKKKHRLSSVRLFGA